jgi:hypothetical protein
VDPAQAEAAAKQKIGLDEAQPTSNIQVRRNFSKSLADSDLQNYFTIGFLRRSCLDPTLFKGKYS